VDKKRAFIILGPPGAGKGTHAARLITDLDLSNISTGDILRDAVKSGTELGRKAQEYMERGELVPDEIVIPIVEEKIVSDRASGFFFDGFPRTLNQADALDEMFSRRRIAVEKVIYLSTPDRVIVERLCGRRVCKVCGATYHVKNIPPIKAGVCDSCGGELIIRTDDDEKTVLNRLEVYRRQTADIINYYRGKGLLTEINGALPVDEVYPRILDALGPKPSAVSSGPGAQGGMTGDDQ